RNLYITTQQHPCTTAMHSLQQPPSASQGQTPPDPIAALGLAASATPAAAAPVAPPATVKLPAPPAPAPAPSLAAQAPQPPSLPPVAAGNDQPPPTSRSGRQYNGHPVSLDFQGADLRAVLRTFAEISGLNI